MKYRIFVNGEERPLTEEEREKITDKLANAMGYKRVEKKDSSRAYPKVQNNQE